MAHLTRSTALPTMALAISSSLAHQNGTVAALFYDDCYDYDPGSCFTMTIEAPPIHCPRCPWLPDWISCPAVTDVTTMTIPCSTSCCPDTPTVTVTTPCSPCSTTCGLAWQATVVEHDCPAATTTAPAETSPSYWDYPPPKATRPARPTDEDDWEAKLFHILHTESIDISYTWEHDWTTAYTFDLGGTTATHIYDQYGTTETIVWVIPRPTDGHHGGGWARQPAPRARRKRRIQLMGYGAAEPVPILTADVAAETKKALTK
ncbi:hypothetical protein CMQ_3682 [Grosmannia clavigera kw1407]|uniref:Uncharacterized protein n=1 Tax=Grosmannia clavigera (strain kw1407 / UAMH 11150) TaxID=655863 RepID=F0X895_GROCL|nr:uncharacterized protein CMQ_3682 [Grosmannia clavigera kw1407]EFX05613.1 hypothetical protein CMQ_3682 [Grosmannia clavigera kw1407]